MAQRRFVSVAGGCLSLAFLFVQAAQAGDPPVRLEDELLFPSDSGDLFADSSDVLGDTIVSGAARDDGLGLDAGAVYTFDRSGASWVERPKLVAGDASAGDLFGWAVKLAGTRLVVGAPLADGLVADTGAAYVYARSGTSWALEQKLSADDGTANDLFGSALALDGDTLLVGASGDDVNGSLSGSAYVFVRSGTVWTQEARLLPSDGSSLDRFGDSVAISGDRAAIGAEFGDGDFSVSGTAYVFARSGTSWAQEAELSRGGAPLSDSRFGLRVAIEGDRVIATSPIALLGGSNRGAAYVFERSGSSWPLTDTILNPHLGEFGWELVLEGDTLLVGSLFGGTSFEGQAHLFRYGGGVWAEEIRLEPSLSQGSFPVSAGLSGNRVVAGTLPFEKIEESSGLLFVYDLIDTRTFCDATDGSLASCPCANPGDPESGCDVAQATGGVELNVLGQDTSPNRATLVGDGFPPAGSPAAIVIRGSGLDAGAPVVFGDGLRCVSTPLVRLGAAFASGGSSTHTFGHGSMAGSGTFSYQLWFRNAPLSFCDPAAAFNLSNGRTLSWP